MRVNRTAGKLAVRATAPPPSPVQRRAPPRPNAGRYAIPDLPVWQQLQRVGGGLTPTQVSAIIRDADNGRMSSLMDLANEVRQKDCHLQAVLATGEESVAGLAWQVVDVAGAKRKDRKIREFVEDVLRSQEDFPRFVAHHAGAVFYGFAVSEILWTKVGTNLVPDTFRPISQRRFTFAPTTGRFHWWDTNSGMAYPGIDIRATFPDQFVISQPRVNGDVACREGLVRALMWAALFRNWALSDWLKLGEIAWKPWRTGTFGAGAQPEDIDSLVAVLEGMTSSGIAVVPEGTNLNISWPTGGANKSNHSELFGVVAAEMSKAVLGQTETTESSVSSGYAQAKIHNEVRKDLREARAKAVAADIRRDVVEPLVRLNFGEDQVVPEFRFDTSDTRDIASFAQGIKTMRDAGVRIPVSWVWDEAGIPIPEDDEEVLGGTSAEAQATQSGGAVPPGPAPGQAA